MKNIRNDRMTDHPKIFLLSSSIKKTLFIALVFLLAFILNACLKQKFQFIILPSKFRVAVFIVLVLFYLFVCFFCSIIRFG